MQMFAHAQTGNDALRTAIPILRAAGIDDAVRDARLLLAFAMGLPGNRLTLHLADDLPQGQFHAYEAAITARVGRKPVAQIIGKRLFWGHEFKVTADTLDPRPETEILVAAALARPFVKILDLGTGTGCILLSCLAAMPMAQGLGVDLSAAAIEVAKDNARALHLEKRARFQTSDWFNGVVGRYDLITSNPPYISQAEMADLAPDVRNHEPHLALSPGGDGLDAYRAIAAGAAARLMAGGRILLEIGPTQANSVKELFAAQGFGAIRVLADMDGRDRVIEACKNAGQVAPAKA